MAHKLVDFGTVTKLSLDWDVKERKWFARFSRIGANADSGLKETYILDQALSAVESAPTLMDAFLKLIINHGKFFNIELDDDMMIKTWKDRIGD